MQSSALIAAASAKKRLLAVLPEGSYAESRDSLPTQRVVD